MSLAHVKQSQMEHACRELLATGGSNPADCQIMRIRDGSKACTSQPALEPVQTLVVGCCLHMLVQRLSTLQQEICQVIVVSSAHS